MGGGRERLKGGWLGLAGGVSLGIIPQFGKIDTTVNQGECRRGHCKGVATKVPSGKSYVLVAKPWLGGHICTSVGKGKAVGDGF